jgi:hypothetical protein
MKLLGKKGRDRAQHAPIGVQSAAQEMRDARTRAAIRVVRFRYRAARGCSGHLQVRQADHVMGLQRRIGAEVGAACSDDLIPDWRRHVGIASLAGEAGIDEDDDVGPFVDRATAVPGKFGTIVF